MSVCSRPSSPSAAKEAMAADDDYTLYSDADSMYSRSNASTESFASYNAYGDLPPFRLPKTDGHREVYEAWTIYLSSDHDQPISSRKFCGITTVKDYDSYIGDVSSISELYDQQDLVDMHLKSLAKYKSAHKRAWPSRLVRGAGRSYEDDVDCRIRRLPSTVQSEVSHLLGDREDASSNRLHNRAWTVVVMQEQLHRRFADASPKVVDRRHRVRFWKNPGRDDRSEYFVVIRGREGRRVTDDRGQCEFKRFENPWHLSDKAEALQKTRQRLAKRREKTSKAVPPPSYRHSPAPPPPPPVNRGPSMYSAPGAYTRPHVGMPYYPPPVGPPPGAGMPYANPQRYQQPPPVPTPPVHYPTPPPVRCAQGFTLCPGGPVCGPAAPAPPPPAPYPTMYAPPAAHMQAPAHPQRFGPPHGPWTVFHCGGPGNGPQAFHPAPLAPAPAPFPSRQHPAYNSFPGAPYGAPRPGQGGPGVGLPFMGMRPGVGPPRWTGMRDVDTESGSDDGSVDGGSVSSSSTGSTSSYRSKSKRCGGVAKAQKEGAGDSVKNGQASDDYRRQLEILEQQNKRRLMLARQDQNEERKAPSVVSGGGREDDDLHLGS